jgi:glycosyltransferase involved in cell wall biosynthesis
MTFSEKSPPGEFHPIMASHDYQPGVKLIAVSVISDLVTDYRVHRVCQTLQEQGYRVLLTGRVRRKSLALQERNYQTDRIRSWFNRSALFYAEFNIRLFFRLLICRADIYLGNDLDVMPATLLAARMRKKPLIYDSHEYFSGMAGLERKPLRRGIWKWFEKRLFRRLKYGYTVSGSIRDQYRREYGKELLVVRNLPSGERVPCFSPAEKEWIASIDRQIPANKNILLLQSGGLNEQRGVEELVLSMQFLDGNRFHLLIIGGGDIFCELQKMIAGNQLTGKVTLIPKVPFSILPHFTQQAHLGLSLEKAAVANHRYCLPNKLFEYLHAGVPVLTSRLVEMERIIEHYQVGTFIEDHLPEHIAGKISEIFDHPEQLARWKENTARVLEELNWENERKIIVNIFKQVERDSVS